MAQRSEIVPAVARPERLRHVPEVLEQRVPVGPAQELRASSSVTPEVTRSCSRPHSSIVVIRLWRAPVKARTVSTTSWSTAPSSRLREAQRGSRSRFSDLDPISRIPYGPAANEGCIKRMDIRRNRSNRHPPDLKPLRPSAGVAIRTLPPDAPVRTSASATDPRPSMRPLKTSRRMCTHISTPVTGTAPSSAAPPAAPCTRPDTALRLATGHVLC